MLAMLDYKTQLLEVETQFFRSSSDAEELKTFQCLWATLSQEIQSAISQNLVDEGTIIQFQQTSLLLGELSRAMIQFHEDVDAIDAAFRRDLDNIFSKWQSSPTTLFSHQSTPSSRRDVSLAAEWLAHNYHNPYPPQSTRDEISRRANWSRKDLDAWFTEARKRIGWNSIRKKFFSNKRVDTVEKATRFFGHKDKSCDPMLAQAFVDMEIRVRELFVVPFECFKLVTTSRDLRANLAPVSSRTLPPSPVSRQGTPRDNIRKRLRSQFCVDDEATTEVSHKRARVEESIVVIPRPHLPSPAASQSDISNNTPEPTPTQSSPNVGSQGSHVALQSPEPGGLHSQPGDFYKRPSIGPKICGSHAVSTPRCAGPDILQNIPHDALTEDLPTEFPNVTRTRPHSVSQSHPLLSPVNQTPPSANVPGFSFDFPSPATCYRPVNMLSTDLDLLDPMCMYAPSAPVHADVGIDFPYSTLFGDSTDAVSPTERHLASISDPFEDTTCTDQESLELLFDYTTPIPLDPLGEINLDLDSSISLHERAHESPADVSDFLLDFAAPPIAGTEKAQNLAYLGTLKQQMDSIQACIRFLEQQVS